MTTTSTTPAGQRWQAMVHARQDQSQRLRDRGWRPAVDFGSSNVESFRAGRDRRDDAAVVDTLRPLLRRSDIFIDVGAGAGRFALPLAHLVREVIAIEPSPAMSGALDTDAKRADLSNVRLVRARWQEAAELRGDVVLSAHAIYALAHVEGLLGWMTTAARRWAAILLFADAPLSWLAPFWPLVHAETRRPAPHLPQLLDVLEDLRLGPVDVCSIAAEHFPLGSADIAPAKLRRRLQVVPGSAADRRLVDAMRELLEERNGVLAVRGAPTIESRLGTLGHRQMSHPPAGRSYYDFGWLTDRRWVRQQLCA